jgi:sugar phosphate isomerase/epimerase
MMHIGADITTFESYGAEKYEKFKQSGFSHAGVQVMCDTDESFEKQLYELRDEKKTIDSAGVIISQVEGPWRWWPHDETEELRADRMAKMKQSLLLTKELGCEKWIVRPLMPFGEDGFHADEVWRINENFFRELLSFAKELDITICIVNLSLRRFPINTPEQILKLVSTINDTHCKACLDTGNAWRIGVSPAEAVRTLGENLATIRVHDNRGKYDEFLVPGLGTVDWNAFAEALRDIGYQGVYHLSSGLSEHLEGAPLELRHRTMYAIAKHIAPFEKGGV